MPSGLPVSKIYVCFPQMARIFSQIFVKKEKKSALIRENIRVICGKHFFRQKGNFSGLVSVWHYHPIYV